MIANSPSVPAWIDAFDSQFARLEELRRTDHRTYLFGTHLEALQRILGVIQPRPEDTLVEFGGGHFSTPLLIATGAQVLTVEQGQNVPAEQNHTWVRQLEEAYAGFPNWRMEVRLGTRAWASVLYPPEIAFAFVDGNGNCRKEVVEFLIGNNVPVIAAHDSEQPSFRYERIFSPAHYAAFDFKGREVWTRIWTTRDDLILKLDSDPAYQPVGPVPSRIDLTRIPVCLIGHRDDEVPERRHRFWNHPEHCRKLHPHTHSVAPMPGGSAYGCSAAHANAVRWAIDHHLDTPVLLMESDAVKTGWFKEVLEGVPADADIIWLGRSNGEFGGFPSPAFLPNPRSEYQRLAGLCQATHSVLLATARGKRSWLAACMRALNGEFSGSTDLAGSILCGEMCRQYVVVHPLFHQPDYPATRLPLSVPGLPQEDCAP